MLDLPDALTGILLGCAARQANKMTGESYRAAGVDIDAGNALVEAIKPLAKATARPGAERGLGGFGALFDLKAAGFKDPILVATTDGVGTKLKIAIETGRHDTIGIDLVAMCVNDLVVQGAEPLFFLDYFATGKLEVGSGRAIVAGIADGCQEAGCALVGGETAEMPGMYAAGDYDLAGFAVGAVERGQALDGSKVAAGDVVLGLASSGRAFQRLLAGAPRRRASRRSTMRRAGAVRAGEDASARRCWRRRGSMSKACRAAIARRRRQGAWPISPAAA